MSYVFSKAINKCDVDAKATNDVPVVNSIHAPLSGKPESDAVDKSQKETLHTNNIKPSIPPKSNTMNVSKKPPVKRKPMMKSQSVDLTQVGGSEWKDFVLKRQQEKELSDPEEQQRFATVRSLNEHRNSLADQTITEDQVLKLTKLSQSTSNHIEYIDDNGMPTTQTDTEPEKSVTSAEGNVPNEPDTKLADVANTNIIDTKDRECHKNADVSETSCTTASRGELKIENDKTMTSNTNTTSPKGKDNVVNAAPVEAITLPKPRQIGSELKRYAFSRNRALSLPVAVTMQQTSSIKRSSDMLKGLAADSISSDSQVPYFCRNSRGSIDMQEPLPEISNLNVNETSDNVSDNVFKDDEPET